MKKLSNAYNYKARKYSKQLIIKIQSGSWNCVLSSKYNTHELGFNVNFIYRACFSRFFKFILRPPTPKKSEKYTF